MEDKEIRDAVNDAWNGMSFFRKVRVFLKTDHFVIGNVTLMDVTICILAFLLVGYALAYKTQLQAHIIIFILLLVCSVILYLRMRFRTHRKAAYLYSRMQESLKHLRKAEKQETDPEVRARIQDAIEKLETTMGSIEDYMNALIEEEKENRKRG